MSPDLTEGERRFLEAFIEYHRDRYSGEWPEEKTMEELDAFLRERMEEGFMQPIPEHREEIAEQAGIDDYEAVVEGLEEKGVIERVVDVDYRLPRESDEDVEDRRVEHTMLRFDPAVVEEMF